MICLGQVEAFVPVLVADSLNRLHHDARLSTLGPEAPEASLQLTKLSGGVVQLHNSYAWLKPTATSPKPAATEAKPAASSSTAVAVTSPEPAAAKPEPAAAEPKPAAAEPEPASWHCGVGVGARG